MANKPKPQTSVDSEGTIIYGNVKANTFIGHDQNNYGIQQPLGIDTIADYAAELRRIKTEILELREGLEKADSQQLESVAVRVQTAIEEVEQPNPVAERVQSTLEKAQKTIILMDDSVKAAAGLGATLAGLAALALKLFGS